MVYYEKSLLGGRLDHQYTFYMETTAQRIKDELAKPTRNIDIVELVDALILHAYDADASDIHIDPKEDKLVVRFRIDGVLKTVHTIPKTIFSEIVCRIKVQANLRTDEQQAPQDGRFRLELANRDPLDIRVSIVPSYHGENIVLRLLTDHSEQYTLKSLGYSEEACKKILKAISRPHGMILVTGPTGSGKTTTLYTFLKMLKSDDVSIITIEDPVEYAIAGITQIQANPGRGLTFANGLRSILRQDPDMIMVGEIRDTETASIAVNTALTGHLLFSTLHTSDAVTTLPRLHDMGIESYLVASTVHLIIAQRLLRKNCEQCKKAVPITDAERTGLAELVAPEALAGLTQQYIGTGCDACNKTGFTGRISINEVLVVNEPIREAIMERRSTSALKRLSIEHGMVPMLTDGFSKVKAGITSIEEVLRVVHE